MFFLKCADVFLGKGGQEFFAYVKNPYFLDLNKAKS